MIHLRSTGRGRLGVDLTLLKWGIIGALLGAVPIYILTDTFIAKDKSVAYGLGVVWFCCVLFGIYRNRSLLVGLLEGSSIWYEPVRGVYWTYGLLRMIAAVTLGHVGALMDFCDGLIDGIPLVLRSFPVYRGVFIPLICTILMLCSICYCAVTGLCCSTDDDKDTQKEVERLQLGRNFGKSRSPSPRSRSQSRTGTLLIA